MKNSDRKLFFLAFTERGFGLAGKLAALTGGEACLSAQAGGVHSWTSAHFNQADALVYVGAAGIAVRAIAPFIKSKTTDPAVIVIDEGGSFIIPVLSGHLGGANDLARELASAAGGIPVITTATDVNGRFAVDEWAKRQNCAVKNPSRIRMVSSKILSGETVKVWSRWPVQGDAPEFVRPADEKEMPDAVVDIYRESGPVCVPDGNVPLKLVPRIAVVGIGCRRGTAEEQIEACFRQFLEENGIEEEAVCLAASIDLKKEEPGLVQFCEQHGLPFVTYTADELKQVRGDFSVSEFVKSVTGVDNVCERSALCAAGNEEADRLLVKKTKYEGVTMALALKPYHPDWKWL